MACPTCGHTVQGIGNGYFWCPRCGTLCGTDGGEHVVPALVGRVRAFRDGPLATLPPYFHERCRTAMVQLGIAESIDPPGERK